MLLEATSALYSGQLILALPSMHGLGHAFRALAQVVEGQRGARVSGVRAGLHPHDQALEKSPTFLSAHVLHRARAAEGRQGPRKPAGSPSSRIEADRIAALTHDPLDECNQCRHFTRIGRHRVCTVALELFAGVPAHSACRTSV